MTDISSDTVLASGTGAVARTISAIVSDIANVKNFGAVGNGSTDDTSAIQSAISSLTNGGTVFFPAGTYKVSSQITSSVRGVILEGSGQQASILSTTSATANILNISGWDSGVQSLGFTSSATRTGGAYIVLSGAFSHIERCRMDGHYLGINLNSPAAPVSVRDCVLHNATPASTAANGGGILINVAGTDVYLDTLLLLNDTVAAPTFGINVVAVGALTLSNCEIVRQGTALLVNPGSSQVAEAIFVTNTYFDTCKGNCVSITPGSGGNVLWVKLTNVWCSPDTGGLNGILLDGTNGTVKNVVITNFMCHNDYGPSNSGIIFQGSNLSDVTIASGMASGWVYGVVAGPNVTDFTITNVSAGSYDPTTPTNTYGIVVSTGASDRYIITNNRVHGNTSGGVVDNGTGTNKVVTNNIT